MIKCKQCKKIIEVDKVYLNMEFGDFCSEKCVCDYITIQFNDCKRKIKRECENCFNCLKDEEHSMFGSNCQIKCKLNDKIDCYDIEECENFIYGDPEIRDYSYYSGDLKIKKARKFNK